MTSMNVVYALGLHEILSRTGRFGNKFGELLF